MRTCLFLLLLLILSTRPVVAQKADGKFFGGDKLDRGIYVAKTSDNSLLTIGFSESFSSSQDVYVLKTDLKGNKLWERTFGGSKSEFGWDFEEVDGGAAYLITGFSDSYANNEDIILLKVSRDGELVWIKNLSNPGNERCWSITKTHDGNYMLVGQSQDRATKNYNGLLTKVDGEGNVLWQRSYGGPEYDRLFYCSENSRNEFFVAGITRRDSVSDNTGWILRVDSKGKELQSRHLSSMPNITTHGLLKLPKDELLLYGYVQADTARAQRSIYLAWLDAKGNLKEQKVTDEKNTVNHGLTAVLSRSGDIVMTGYSRPLTSNAWDGVFYRFKQNGDLVKKVLFGGGEADQPYTIAEISPDEFVITGVTYSYGTRKGDLWLVFVNQNGEILSPW